MKLFLNDVSVCRIYRSPWICNSGHLDVIWTWFWHFHDFQEPKEYYCCFSGYSSFGWPLCLYVPAGPPVHLSRHVSINFNDSHIELRMLHVNKFNVEVQRCKYQSTLTEHDRILSYS